MAKNKQEDITVATQEEALAWAQKEMRKLQVESVRKFGATFDVVPGSVVFRVVPIDKDNQASFIESLESVE